VTTHFTPDLPTFRTLARQGNLIPVYSELIADAETPVGAFAKLDDGGYTFLFESVEKSEQMGRYSFLIVGPRIILESHGRTVRVTEDGQTREFETTRDPLADLESLMARYRSVPLPSEPPELRTRFAGGAVGFLGYDMVRFFEPTVPAPAKDELGLPESLFVIADTILIFDHLKRRLRLVANALIGAPDSTSEPTPAQIDAAYSAATQRLREISAKLAQPLQLPPFPITPAPVPADAASNTTREEYLSMVTRGQEYIRAGDVFQFVPSQRFSTDYTGDPLTLYRALRFVNPSPYMFCMKFPAAPHAGREAFSLVGSSPEVHVRAIDGRIDIRPIAGTRRRGADEVEDDFNAADLLADPKERAEHLMLVDLARNDVGRASEYGSVKVNDFMIVERYSHVMHIVSNVEGRLRADRSAYDVMRATFPAGTVSGSPKVRAMQVINEFELSKRGIYAGAVGYFGFDGNSDSCIALRTIVLKGGKAYVQAGAGVVADSTPEGEYNETVNKAMGMMAAIARAKQLSGSK
jgi:anthranilate synthase component 1